MASPDWDAVPKALLAEQAELDAEYDRIKDLRSDDRRVAAYADRLMAHGKRVIDFAECVRLGLNARSN